MIDKDPDRKIPLVDEIGHTMHDTVRWIIAGAVVVTVYGAGAAGLYYHKPELELLAGTPEAIMLEFGEEVEAPDVEKDADTIQQAMRADEIEKQQPEETKPEEEKPEEVKPNPQPVEEEPQTEPKEIKTPEPEILKPVKPEKPKEKPQTKAEKPKPVKPKPVKEKKTRQPPPVTDRAAPKGDRNQLASGRQIDAKHGSTYRAPQNSRSNGSNGTSDKAWADRVYRKIKGASTRAKRQLPGARGRVVISVSYDGSGRITSSRLSAPSGNTRMDNLALDVVRHSSPLPSPPEGKGGNIAVPIVFN